VDNLPASPTVLHHGLVTVTDLTDTIIRLRTAGCVFAEEEAAVLGGAATDPAQLSALVDRRVRGEPLEQVVGFADFCGVRVHLRPGVFVPRVRSELLVHTAVAELDTPGATVVDLCCGSGALGLAVRRLAPTIRLLAADSDPVAVACALDNLGGDVFQGDLFGALPEAVRGSVDVLLANVPYVATEHISLLPAEARLHEPRTALDGGADGLDVFRAVVAGAPAWLAPGGLLLSEITEAQTDSAVAAVRAAGLLADVVDDEDLEARAVIGRRPELPAATALR
jgi:release factor glutamine methyltransferase